MTILIADANVAFASQLKELLDAMEGMEVAAVASDGEEAVELLRVHRPDAMVLDLMLSRRDGLDVLKLSQQMDDPPAVLATSAFVTEFVLNIVMELGAKYLMPKPCNMEALVERLLQITQRQGPMILPAEPVSDWEYERMATDSLRACMIPVSLKGFSYLRIAIGLCLEVPDRIHYITKDVYPVIASMKGIRVELVERNMRTAIERNWDRGGKEALERFLGCRLPVGMAKPANSEFIALVTEKLRCRLTAGAV